MDTPDEMDTLEETYTPNKKEMWGVRLIIAGIGVLLLSVILLLILSFYPSSYLSTAIANVFAIPSIWGIALIIGGLALFRQGVASKLMLAIMLVLVGTVTMQSPFTTSLRDVHAVINDDLYITEGVVVDTVIKRKSSSNNRGKKDKYREFFTLDNEVSDTFMIFVEHMSDYQMTLGSKYRVIALPHSKQLLEYEEIGD